MYCLGIDVHKHDSHVAVVDDDGEIVEEGRVENANLKEIAEAYAGSAAAIEATSNYYTIYDTLDEYLDVAVANPSKTKLIAESKRKTDRVDAKQLAHLLRTDFLAESYVPPQEIRERRALVRGRKDLVEERTEYKNKIHGLLDQQGITYDGTDVFSQTGREFLAELSLDAVTQTLLDAYLTLIDTLTEQIEALEEQIEQRAASLEATQRLMSIPGVSYYSALLLHAEIGEIDRFDRDKELVSYAGLAPVVRESGDSRTEGNITKEGPGQLRWILVQCAQVAVHNCNDEYFGRFYHRLKRQKNHHIAIVATARKMLVSIFHMLTNEEVYDPPGV